MRYCCSVCVGDLLNRRWCHCLGQLLLEFSVINLCIYFWKLLVTMLTSFSSRTREPVEYRHTSFALHCCLLLRALREKMVEKCILLSSCHSLFIDICHSSLFSFRFFIANLEKPSIIWCSLYETVPYSCCPFQLFWCVFLCWLWSAVYISGLSLMRFLVQFFIVVIHFFITLNILILLANFVTLLHVPGCTCVTPWPVSSHPYQDVHPWKIKKIIDVIVEIESFTWLFWF